MRFMMLVKSAENCSVEFKSKEEAVESGGTLHGTPEETLAWEGETEVRQVFRPEDFLLQ
jgi:hypothetical protein